MGSKRDRLEKLKTQVSPSVIETADDIYGGDVPGLPRPGKRISANPLDIFTIRPNPTQPRRILPGHVRSKWDGTPEGLGDLFKAWLEMAENERGEPIPLRAYLVAGAAGDDDSGDSGIPRPTEPGPADAALLRLVDLAGSILRDKLTNPITVVKQGDVYQIETGERRWFAYHLLWQVFGEPDDDDDASRNWRMIPAQVMNEYSVWRQAGENNARKDLNAIGMARQFALLLMDLYTSEQNVVFKTFEDLVKPGDVDRIYYAQVADGETLPIPWGKAEMLVNAMGLKHNAQLRYTRALLRLPDEVWQIADDHDWTEGRLRPMTSMPEDKAIKEARRIMQMERMPKPPAHPSNAIAPPKPPSKPTYTFVRRADWNRTKRAVKFANSLERQDFEYLDPVQRTELRDAAVVLRQLADALENAIRR